MMALRNTGNTILIGVIPTLEIHGNLDCFSCVSVNIATKQTLRGNHTAICNDEMEHTGAYGSGQKIFST